MIIPLIVGILISTVYAHNPSEGAKSPSDRFYDAIKAENPGEAKIREIWTLLKNGSHSESCKIVVGPITHSRGVFGTEGLSSFNFQLVKDGKMVFQYQFSDNGGTGMNILSPFPTSIFGMNKIYRHIELNGYEENPNQTGAVIGGFIIPTALIYFDRNDRISSVVIKRTKVIGAFHRENLPDISCR